MSESKRELFSQDPGSSRDRLPRLAATTVLLRPRDGAAGQDEGWNDRFEIFFVKRHSQSDFMGGAHVFPGGKVDLSDGDETWLDRFTDEASGPLARLEPTPGRTLNPPDVTGSIVAAARELFEEAGILLARDPQGAPVDPLIIDPELARLRDTVHEDASTFASLFETHGLRLDLSALGYFAHWVTPSLERRRFDARFFLARLPENQQAQVDHAELVEGVWHTPRAALDAVTAGAMILPPPTLRTVEWLATQPTIDAAFDVAAKQPVAAILPKVAQTERGVGVLLPWDPGYTEASGDSLPGSEEDLAGFGPSKIVLEDGRWKSID